MKRILIITGVSVAFIATSFVQASAAPRQPQHVVNKGKVLGKTKVKTPPTKVTTLTSKPRIFYGRDRDRDRGRDWRDRVRYRDHDRDRFRGRERFGHDRDRDRRHIFFREHSRDRDRHRFY
jgi:hypothetical protein